MKYTLELIASDDAGDGSIREVTLTVAPDATMGLPDTARGALEVVIQKLSEIPGFSIS